MHGSIRQNTPACLKVTLTSFEMPAAAQATMPFARSSSRTNYWERVSGLLSTIPNCGMELFTDDVIGDLLADNLETAKFDGGAWSNPKHGHGSDAGQFVKWHTIKDQPSSVVQDVRRIREHPLVAKHIPIYGYIYDVHSGGLIEVTEATEAGRPA
jgi:hypothetical protein